MDMDEKHEKAGVILRNFWTDHQADRPDGGGCYDEPDAEEIDDLFAEIREVLTEDHDLLLWVKVREVGYNIRASEQRGDAESPADAEEALQAAFSQGMAEAYRDTWRQIQFAGCSVADGTLDPDVAARAEEEWKHKAEEEMKKKGWEGP